MLDFSILRLKSFYGHESKYLEFKEFCLRDHDFEKEDIIDMIEKDYWCDTMNSHVKYNLEKYVHQLIPKYLTCFGNARINGKVVIGVNDYGEITGIPYKGDLFMDFKEIILKTIGDNIYSSTQTNLEEFSKYISFSFKKVEIKEELLDENDEMSDIYNKYREQIVEINEIERRHYDDKLVWFKELYKYSTKLNILINTRQIRDELIDYIEIFNENEENKRELISLLKTDELINVPIGMNIIEPKSDTNTMVHWLTEYKDYQMDRVLSAKPRKPMYLPLYSIENNFARLTPLINRYVKKDISYYVLEISFNMEKNEHDLMFRNPINNKWLMRCRTIIDGNPCCV